MGEKNKFLQTFPHANKKAPTKHQDVITNTKITTKINTPRITTNGNQITITSKITIPVLIISKATTQTIISKVHGTRILTMETGTKNQIGVVNRIMVKIIGTLDRNFSRIKTNRLMLTNRNHS